MKEMPTRNALVSPQLISTTALIITLLLCAACSAPVLPELPTGSEEETTIAVLAEEDSMDDAAVAAESEKQAPVAAAAEAAKTVADIQADSVEAQDAAAEASTEQTDIVDASAEQSSADEPAAPAEVNWLTVSNRVEHELPALGNPDAPLTITEFSDFMWPGCRAHVLGVENELKSAFVQTGQVRFIFNPVLNHGDRSVQSHMASECAGDQGQFWPFRTYLFENQDRMWRGDIRQTVKDLAAKFGLETGDFNACIDEQRHLARLNTQDQVRKDKGIQGQPMFDVGGDVYGGTATFDAWSEVINAKVGN